MDSPDAKTERSPFQTPALLAALIAALVTAISLTPTPVPDSGRPPALSPAEQAGSIEARMWEDPLASPLKSSAAATDSSAASDCGQIDSQFNRSVAKGERHMRLFVIANAGGASEDSERRIRARAAVLSALNRWGYEPGDSEHLIGPCRFASLDKQSGFETPVRATIERFHLRKDKDLMQRGRGRGDLGATYAGRADQVSVFWIADAPLRLADTVQEAARRYRVLGTAFDSMVAGDEEAGGARYVTLGPLDRDVTDRVESGMRCRPSGARSGSGGDEDKNLPTCPDQAGAALTLRHFRSQVTIDADTSPGDPSRHVLEIGPTDDMLANTLVAELERRGLNLMRPSDHTDVIDARRSSEAHRYACLFDHHVALVSEWDTHHARDFRRAFGGHLGQVASQWRAELRRSDAANVHGFAFTRGLDGKGLQSRSGEGGTTPTSGGAASGNKPPDAAYERSTLQSQRDYVRRLVEQIAERDVNLKAVCGRGSVGIRAIGILASDFYDKRMLLQALRARFPQVQFFTTGLDSRMLDHESSSAMRNVLVVSRFDLKLAPPVQRFVIPFRDGEQTALFLTTSVALLGNSADRDAVAGWVGRWNALTPRLHEIGLTRAHPLNEYARRESCPQLDITEAPENLLRCQDIHPPRDHLSGGTLITITVALGLFVITLYLLGATVWSPNRDGTLLGLCVALVVLVVWPVVCYGWLRDTAEAWAEEPFAWLDGISIWPSLWLRWCALVLSGWLLWLARKRIGHTLDGVAQRFGLTGARPPASRRAWRWRRLLHDTGLTLRRRLRSACIGPHVARAQVDAHHAWLMFRHAMSPGPQLLIGTLWACLMMGVFALIGLNYPVLPPVRGKIAIALFIAVAAAGTFVLLVLMFLSLSVALRLMVLARQLSANRSDWPQEAVDAAVDALQEQYVDPAVISGAAQDAGNTLVERAGQPGKRRIVRAATPTRLDRLLDHYIDILLIEQISRHNEWLLIFPGIVLSLVLASRWDYFEAWTVDPMALVLFGVFGVCALLTVWIGQSAAKQARRTALRGLDGLAASLRNDEQCLTQLLRHVQRYIGEVDSGIFRASHWNMVRATLLPLASAGGLRAVEVLLGALQ